MPDVSRYSDDQWRAASILDRGDHIESVKDRFGLPVRTPDGHLDAEALQKAAADLAEMDVHPLVKSVVAGHLGACFAEAGLPVRLDKAALSAQQRRDLPASDFVFPATREYPIPDVSHARSALSLGALHETGARLAQIRRRVKEKFPQIDVTKAESTAEFEVTVPVLKADDDPEGLVYGVVMNPEVRDSQGDVVSAEQIQKAAHGFMLALRQNQHDVQHDDRYRNSSGDPLATTVESFIAPQDLMIGEHPVRKGAWVMAAKIHDPEVKELVRKGELTGFSITGMGVRRQDRNL